ncbi:MAG: NAD(P)H-dependent oxidoreductase [Brevinema sp.]
MNIKLWLAHPNYQKSVANKAIVQTLSDQYRGIEIRHLDSLYPDLNIDIELEKQKLLEADLIILQYPFFWVGMPSLMLHWKEQVFHEGFGYYPPNHPTKSALHGKKLLVSFTAGAPEAAYSKEGFIGAELADFFPPIEAIANFTGMQLLDILYFLNARVTEKNSLEQLQDDIKKHTELSFSKYLK